MDRFCLGILCIGATLAALPAQAGVKSWTSLGPFGGPALALAIDPKTPKILYEGNDGGGVFKTTNGGQSWSYAGTGLTDPTVLAIAVDPKTPTTLYAAGGNGIFKSTNAAASWSEISGIVNVNRIAIDPVTTTTLYANVSDGAAEKSTDGGKTWKSLYGNGLTASTIYTLVVDPAAHETVYAGALEGVYKSTNGGASWTLEKGGLTTLGTYPQILSIAIDPLHHDVLYAAASSAIVKSSDGGVQWTILKKGLPANGLYPNAVAVDPKTTSIVYAGTSAPGAVYVSRDSGASWAKQVAGFPATSPNDEVRTFAIDPATPADIYAATDTGVLASTNRGTKWSAANKGLATTQVTAVAVNPKTPSTVYAGTEYDGMFKSTNGGSTWATIDTGLASPSSNGRGPAGAISAIVVNPTTPSTLYIGSEDSNGVFKSVDSGAHWARADGSLLTYLGIVSLAIDPKHPVTLFAGSSAGVAMTTNSATSWKTESGGLPSGFVPVSITVGTNSIMAVDVYQGAYIAPYASGKTTTLAWAAACSSTMIKFLAGMSGDTLTVSQLKARLTALGFYSYWVDKLTAACPNSAERPGPLAQLVDAVVSAALNITDCPPYTTAVLSPAAPTTLFASSSCGVIMATGLGASVTDLSTGLPVNETANAVTVVPSGATLFAGTQGHGAYKYQF